MGDLIQRLRKAAPNVYLVNDDELRADLAQPQKRAKQENEQ